MTSEPTAEGERDEPAPVAALLITSEDFETLRPEWELLHASLPEATVYQHPAWFANWLEHFGSEVRPVFLSFRRGVALVAVAQLDMRSAGEGPVQLGDANVSDYGGLLAVPGEEVAVATGLVEWLIEDLTRSITLWGIAQGPWPEALRAGADAFGWEATTRHEAMAPAAVLPPSFDEFVAALGKKDRHELRRKLRNLQAAGKITFEIADHGDVAAQLNTFFSLMRASRADKAAFLTDPMEGFFRGFAAALADLAVVRLGFLAIDGAKVAAVLTFENAGTTYLYNSGFDPALGHLAVGLLSKAYAIEDAIARGKTTFDFLRGEEEYKARLGGVPRPVITVRLQQP